MARDRVRTYVRKFFVAIGMFAVTILVFGFFILLLSSTFGPILHEGTIGFFFFGPPLGIICALDLAVCGWREELSFQSFISTGILVVDYLICLFLASLISGFFYSPASQWFLDHTDIVVILIIFSLVGYLILQYKTLHHLSGIWMRLALMPLIIAIVLSVLGNDPLILLISTPFAMIYLAVLLFWHKLLRSKNVR